MSKSDDFDSDSDDSLEESFEIPSKENRCCKCLKIMFDLSNPFVLGMVLSIVILITIFLALKFWEKK